MRLNYPNKVSEEGFQVMVLSLSILKKSFNDFLSARMLLINLGPVLLSYVRLRDFALKLPQQSE
ncbi:hypothetical protein HpHA117_03390 [Helicobacter pylori]